MRMSTTTELAPSPSFSPPDARSLMADGSLSPSSPQSPVASGQSLSSELMDDLLDPTNTPVQICKVHGLTLADLATIVESHAYQTAAAQIRSINAARQPVIDSSDQLQSRALQCAIANAAYMAAADIDDLAASRDPRLAATKSRHLETARKAACSSPVGRAFSPSSPPPSPPLIPRPNQPRQAWSGHSDQPKLPVVGSHDKRPSQSRTSSNLTGTRARSIPVAPGGVLLESAAHTTLAPLASLLPLPIAHCPLPIPPHPRPPPSSRYDPP